MPCVWLLVPAVILFTLVSRAETPGVKGSGPVHDLMVTVVIADADLLREAEQSGCLSIGLLGWTWLGDDNR